MDNNLKIDFSEFMDQLDIFGKQYVLDNNIEPKQLEQICIHCGKKFFTFWDYDKCFECREIDTKIREK